MRNKRIYTYGERVGNLVFIKEIESKVHKNGKKERRGIFKCVCGNEFEARIRGNEKDFSKSCGCLKTIVSTVHGLRWHPVYPVWKSIKYRCYNKNGQDYYRYGGRGIKVCDEWKNDFKAFYDWAMENGYKKGLQIDRINNDGDYEPDNCRFVKCKVNVRNRSNVKLTVEKVKEIRQIKLNNPSITNVAIGKMFDVHGSTIGPIIKNKTWV